MMVSTVRAVMAVVDIRQLVGHCSTWITLQSRLAVAYGQVTPVVDCSTLTGDIAASPIGTTAVTAPILMDTHGAALVNLLSSSSKTPRTSVVSSAVGVMLAKVLLIPVHLEAVLLRVVAVELHRVVAMG
jgi:hypothetical protein